VSEVKRSKKDAKPTEKLDNRADKRDDGPKTTKNIYGSASIPRIKWRKNMGGVVRTRAEAIEIAKKAGVEIPDWIEINRIVGKDVLPDNVGASYAKLRSDYNGGRFSWKDFEHEITKKVPVRLNENIMDSDEAIIANIKHEVHELTELRDALEGRMVSAEELADLISDDKGILHSEAWDEADKLIIELRK
jgi:hypothetical protein